MDTVTQMLFGATVAQAGFRGRLGRRAMVAGAALGLIPDLDVVAGWIGGPFATWEHHRGLTHSLLFAPVAGALLGWLIWRSERKSQATDDGERLRAWVWLSILVLMTHPLIDLFTSYGTQLLWPLTNTRFAIDALPIIDPIYSAVLAIALVVGSMARVKGSRAQDTAAAALLFVAIYSFSGWAINERIETIAAADFEAEFGQPAAVDAYPLLFQPFYRRVVALGPEAAHVGYYSTLNPKPIAWRTYPIVAGPEVAAVRATPEAALFDWFAMNKLLWRTVQNPDGSVRVEATDLRYGLPGETDLGFWGIRVQVGEDQSLTSPVEMFRVPREATGPALRQFWSDLTGW